ncbi:hypothetical protein K3888_08765 [Dietzia aurantiaca]|uniref:hypothetical protein n=1 Tax=Dietzia aurantiaca TaxID=983873 RepID=UPI001E4C5478|nr:hypothetical protein [Dietzia aurantiaca]MCD2262792.1 hypothetical protein [Dietzia aurantiaca]
MDPAKGPGAGSAQTAGTRENTKACRSAAEVDEARAEAARLRDRLGVASARLEALLAPGDGSAPGEGAAQRRGVARFDDDAINSELRSLLAPAAARVARLLELAASVADGALTEESATRAARAIAAEQPHRRPR